MIEHAGHLNYITGREVTQSREPYYQKGSYSEKRAIPYKNEALALERPHTAGKMVKGNVNRRSRAVTCRPFTHICTLARFPPLYSQFMVIVVIATDIAIDIRIDWFTV